MDFQTIDQLILYIRANGLAYSTVTYCDKRLMIVAFREGTDSFVFNEYTGDRV